jgi:hypothetical protein
MTTVTEILHAAERLELKEQEELAQKLSVLLAKSHSQESATDRYELPPDFTERLTDAFNEARRTAIQRGKK